MEDFKSEAQLEELQGPPFFEYDPLFFPITESVRKFIENYDRTQRNFPQILCKYDNPTDRADILYARVREVVRYILGISNDNPDEGNASFQNVVDGFRSGHSIDTIKLEAMRAQVYARRSEFRHTTHIVDTIPISMIFAWMSQSLGSIQEVFQMYKK